MKNMEDYQKKYEEALDNFKKIKAANKDNKELVDFIEYKYPELKESKDERIRRELIKVFEERVQHGFEWKDGIPNNAVIAWLEKQGEHKCDCKYVGCHVNDVKRWCHKKQAEILYENCNIECSEYLKQGEQKPTNKIKPRFKVGDTIRLKGSMAEYTIESISGECYHGKGWGLSIGCDEDYELVEQKPAWSEEDEHILEAIIKEIEANKAAGPEYDEKVYDMFLSWLKSLKERYSWKPSKKQIIAIEDAIKFLGCTKKVREDLKSLYEQLKKLREE